MTTSEVIGTAHPTSVCINGRLIWSRLLPLLHNSGTHSSSTNTKAPTTQTHTSIHSISFAWLSGPSLCSPQARRQGTEYLISYWSASYPVLEKVCVGTRWKRLQSQKASLVFTLQEVPEWECPIRTRSSKITWCVCSFTRNENKVFQVYFCFQFKNSTKSTNVLPHQLDDV